MFDPANEPSFRLDVAGLPDSFEVLAFTGREAISEPFVFDVDLLIDDPALDLAGLLYRPVFLQFEATGNGVHGQLHELVQREYSASSRLCRVRLGPRLACLARRFSQRIFSRRAVPQILEQILKEHGITGGARRFELGGDFPPRPFCTQYRESDLQFFQRLCAEERLHYYFEHRRRGYCLVIADGHASHVEERVLRGESASHLMSRFDVQRCAPGAFARARVMQTAQGRTALASLRSGQLLPMSDHSAQGDQPYWVLTHVEHQGDQLSYSNHIHAVPWSVPLLATQVATKPRMPSLQRAWVVEVDEARPDPSRPVAVQFDWMYQGEGATPGHCWLPLAPDLDGLIIEQLRDGVEVVVSFIDGDPDQPLISGLLHGPTCTGAPDAPDSQPAPANPEHDGLLSLLQTSEPLVLLCLLPEGGSFSHCRQAVCTCRAAMLLGRSGMA